MKYAPYKPEHLGKQLLLDIDLSKVVKWINWKYFFKAWKIIGNYEGLEASCTCHKCQTAWLAQFPNNEKEKAKEALTLYSDAIKLLKKGIENKRFIGNAMLYFSEARGEIDGIKLINQEGKVELYIPTIRQQHLSERNQHCLSLCDFISPNKDYIGIFATTIIGTKEWCEELGEDTYQSLLIQTLSDRLVEASAEWLHNQVRTHYWGYDKLNNSGIRPAFGYPSLPDLSLLFDVNDLLLLNEIGINLSENAAMYPNSSICGLYIAHPQSIYFIVGDIGEDQLQHYAKQRNTSPEKINKWIAKHF